MNFNANRKAPVVLTSALVLAMSSMGVLSFYDFNQKDKELTTKSNEVSYRNVLANAVSSKNASKVVEANSGFAYLSDLPYMEDITTVGWGKLTLDANLDGNLISLIVDGETKTFLKGITAHARAEVAYDLTGYNYDYLTAYLGIDASRGSNSDGVRFAISTSEDGTTWSTPESIANNAVFTGTTESYSLRYPVTGVKYLKIIVIQHGNATADHAVIAGAKLVKADYQDVTNVDWIKPLSYYDEEVKKYSEQELLDNYQLALYQREFVSKVGYDNLQMLASYNKATETAIKWLFDDAENLRMYLISGAPDGSYIKSLQVLTRLYENYHEDFDNTESTKYGYTTMGTLYRRMAISLSLTHSKTSYFWMNGAGQPKTNSDAVNRYRIFKEIYLTGRMRFTSTLDYTKWFEQYEIGEMRYVMNSIMDDDEMIWLNDYTQSFIDANPKNPNWYISPHPYMKYLWPNYGRPEYYDEANKEKYDEKYKGIFSKYGVPFGEKGVARTWMNIEGGAVCGGISKQGASNQNAHGVPATVVSQPGHAAFAYYQMNNNGDGYWFLNNWITGWQQSGKTERLNDRMPLGWGNDSYVSGWAASYILLAQEAMNHNAQYEAAEKYIMIAEAYKDNASKREEYLRKSLEALPYNVDAWWALIQLYNQDSTKTEQDYYELASDLAEALYPFPLPMKNLLDQLAGKFTSADFVFKYNLLVVKKLTEGKNLPNSATDKVYNPSYTRDVASFLLGTVNTSLATFSFDGEHAGEIVIGSHLDSYDVHWDYSLDGMKTWKEVYFSANEPHSVKLTEEELASITDENNIYVHILGVSPEYNDTNTFKIEITSGSYPSNIYGNDLENRVIGDTSLLEWRYSDTDEWKMFANEEPVLTGDKTISVRLAATGTRLASEEHTYTFTQDIEDPHMKYIPISHLSINGYSSQSQDTNRPFYAPNAIDGNGTTLWHTDFAQNVLQQPVKPFISVELDEAKNISGLEFIQIKYPNKPQDPDQIKNARVYVSSNGNDWVEAGKVENCATYGSLYRIEFEQSVYGKYVKLEMDTYNMFASLAMINLYENTEVTLSGSFSLDGDNAGKIMLNGEDLDFSWSYSLDGENTWHNATGAEHKLTDTELSSLTVENGIVLRRNNSDSKYIIHITKSVSPQRAYLNDQENRLIAVSNVDKLEWKIIGETKWVSYSEQEPIVTGNKTLLVRTKASGVALPSDAIDYTFTADTDTEERKYVSVKHMSIHSVSSEATGQGRHAKNIIDANPNTSWHSDWNGRDKTKELVIKLDSAKYINSLEYLPLAGGNGKPEVMTILVSMDGVNYTQVAETDWHYANGNDVALRSIDFEPTKAQYIKIVGKKTQAAAAHLSFMAGAMINLYEDTTKEEHIDQNVELQYSTKNPTNEDVKVTISSDKDITITNNNGSNEYVFTENGSFTFEYIDVNGDAKTILAVVDWIDKQAPTAEITYSITSLTNQNVKVTIIPNEEVTVTNNNGSKEYTFTENGSFTFEFIDKAGNIGTATAFVSWINKDAPYGSITYSHTTATNQDVKVRLNIAEGVRVTNNNGSKEYIFTENGSFTFEFVDAVGNVGNATATVNYIDKQAPTATAKYNITEPTNKAVTVTITPSEKVNITNNNGSKEYTFTKNGSFTFEFVDDAGNKGSYTATVDWIDTTAPTGEITYNIDTLTNKNVEATIKVEPGARITNNNGSNKYVFTKNGSFTFELVDAVGNKGSVTATVDWIDTTAPTATITYSSTEPTNEDVTVTLVDISEDATIINNNGSASYTFTENGVFEFILQDKAGNITKYPVVVNNIFKDAPAATIKYNITDLTNKDVTATIECDEEIEIVNNDGSFTYTFTENGEFTFIYRDKLGNENKVIARVDWIDKEVPIASINYSTEEETDGDVVVTISCDEEIIITNNDGSFTYTFTENGEFTFEYEDKLGNKGSITVYVSWIKKEETPDKPVDPTDPTDPENPENPDKPDKPEEPDKPVTPVEPVEPSEPTEPEKPNKPGDSENIPEKPNDKPNKPSKPSNTVTNKPQNSNNTLDKTTSSSVKEEESSQNYSADGITIKVDSVKDASKYTLKKNSLELNDLLKSQITGVGEYFDLYLEYEDSSKNYLASKNVEITMNVSANNKIEKVYLVGENGELTELSYEKVNSNKIKITSKGLGKYIVTYEEDIEIPMTKEEKKNRNLLWYVIGAGVVIISGAAGTAYYKRKENYR